MSEDAVRHIFDHLLLLGRRPIPKLDIFLVSNGGSGTVPWRLVSLFREFASELGVLIPYRAYSAASLLALGADEIVMHPFAELGPIDPTVSNEFNPVDQATRQRIGISVEDVRAYVNFVKETVGITHEDELVKALEALAEKLVTKLDAQDGGLTERGRRATDRGAFSRFQRAVSEAELTRFIQADYQAELARRSER